MKNLQRCLAAALALGGAFACTEPGATPEQLNEPETGQVGAALNGGETDSGLDSYEAVGIVNGLETCSGTLVSDVAVVTARSCVCSNAYYDHTCRESATFTLVDVFPKDDLGTPEDESLTRTDVSMSGDVVIGDDRMVMIRLHQPYYYFVEGVKPLSISSFYPVAGAEVTLVSAGRQRDCTSGVGSGSTTSSPRRHQVNAVIDRIFDDQYLLEPPNGSDRTFCPEDRGAAVILSGQVVAVAKDDDKAQIAPKMRRWLRDRGACPDHDRYHPDVWNQCSNPLCPCDVGGADCDSDNECEAGLECRANVGDRYGYGSSGIDVCACIATPAPGISACTPGDCPCGFGHGDCDSDADCLPDLVCGHNIGSDFGMPSNWDVCVDEDYMATHPCGATGSVCP